MAWLDMPQPSPQAIQQLALIQQLQARSRPPQSELGQAGYGLADAITGALGGFAQMKAQQQQQEALARILQGAGIPGQQAADIQAAGGGDALLQALVKRSFPEAPPQITPYQEQELALRREGLDLQREKAGRPAEMTPYQREMLNLQRERMNKPKAAGQEPLVEIFDPESPSGTRFVPRSEAVGKYGKPASGLTFETTPDGGVRVTQGRQAGASAQTPERAAKTQMVEQAVDTLAQVEKRLFDPDGSPNRSLILGMNAPAMARNFVGGEPRETRIMILDAIEAKLRAESGAAVPESEVERAAERFMPSVTDAPETIRTRMRLLREFLKGTSARISGEKPAAAIDFTREDVEHTAQQEGMTADQVIENVAKSRGLDPAEVKRALGYAP